jgi:hypothetical protein
LSKATTSDFLAPRFGLVVGVGFVGAVGLVLGDLAAVAVVELVLVVVLLVLVFIANLQDQSYAFGMKCKQEFGQKQDYSVCP